MADTSFTRPELRQLISQAESEFNANLPGAEARLRRNLLNALSKITSGQTHGLYGYLKWISRQAIITTANTPWLLAWGRIWKVQRKAGQKATSETVTFSGSNGSIIPIGTELQRGDGLLYLTTTEGTISNGTAVVEIEAEEVNEEGSDYNAQAGTTLNLVSPVSGVQSEATATNGISGGAEIEDIEVYRQRIINRIQQPPHGGALSDYDLWALENDGVTRSWPYPNTPLSGQVTVRFVMDNKTTLGPENILKYSEVFTNAYWQKLNGTSVAVAASLHPEEFISAYKIEGQSGVNSYGIESPDVEDAKESTNYSFSIYAKKYDLDFLAIRTTNKGNVQAVTYFNLDAGEVGTSDESHTASIESAGNDFYRCSVLINVGSGEDDVKVSYLAAQADDSLTFDGEIGILVGGAQVRQSSALEEYKMTEDVTFIGNEIIPGKEDLQRVQDYIESPARKPVTAQIFVVAPTPIPLNITISELTPDNATVRAGIEAELKDMINRESKPGGTIKLSKIWEAISIASGEESHKVTSPAEDKTYNVNEIPVLGTIEYV